MNELSLGSLMDHVWQQGEADTKSMKLHMVKAGRYEDNDVLVVVAIGKELTDPLIESYEKLTEEDTKVTYSTDSEEDAEMQITSRTNASAEGDENDG